VPAKFNEATQETNRNRETRPKIESRLLHSINDSEHAGNPTAAHVFLDTSPGICSFFVDHCSVCIWTNNMVHVNELQWIVSSKFAKKANI
jgi:hypothetical protein